VSKKSLREEPVLVFDMPAGTERALSGAGEITWTETRLELSEARWPGKYSPALGNPKWKFSLRSWWMLILGVVQCRSYR
jgi:hypothetical protein